MNKSQEELERILADRYFGSRADEDLIDWDNKTINFGEFAKAILDAGYVKLSDVELDKSKLWEIVAKNLAGKTEDIYLGQRITDAIAQAKGIIKVKE